MTITTLGIGHIQPIVSLIAGILILIMPQLLNYIALKLHTPCIFYITMSTIVAASSADSIMISCRSDR
jgi:Protein of unknown function (DUF3096)